MEAGCPQDQRVTSPEAAFLHGRAQRCGWAKDSTQVMRSQRLIGQSFALPGAPFEVESSCLPKTGGGAERTKKVEDRTDAKSTQKVEGRQVPKEPRRLRIVRCQKTQKVENRTDAKSTKRLRTSEAGG